MQHASTIGVTPDYGDYWRISVLMNLPFAKVDKSPGEFLKIIQRSAATKVILGSLGVVCQAIGINWLLLGCVACE